MTCLQFGEDSFDRHSHEASAYYGQVDPVLSAGIRKRIVDAKLGGPHRVLHPVE